MVKQAHDLLWLCPRSGQSDPPRLNRAACTRAPARPHGAMRKGHSPLSTELGSASPAWRVPLAPRCAVGASGWTAKGPLSAGASSSGRDQQARRNSRARGHAQGHAITTHGLASGDIDPFISAHRTSLFCTRRRQARPCLARPGAKTCSTGLAASAIMTTEPPKSIRPPGALPRWPTACRLSVPSRAARRP
jgi:hypothetical protein